MEMVDGPTVPEMFQRKYPAGVKRAHLLAAPLFAALLIAPWVSPFISQAGAIAWNTKGNAGYAGAGVTSVTLTDTAFASSGSDDALFAAGASDRSGSGTTMDSLTYGGAALTLNSGQSGPSSQTIRSGVKVAPLSGSRNLVATFSSVNTNMGVIYLAYTGVDQTTPLSQVTGVSGTGNSIASWALTIASDSIVVGFCAHLANGITVTAVQGTVRQNGGDGSQGNWGRLVGGDTAAGSGNLAWNTNGNPPSYGQAFEVKAVAAAAAAERGAFNNQILRSRVRVY